MQPWKLMADYGSYIFGWLVGYSGFLGPIAGVLICDYFVVRKKLLVVEDLYRRNGQYEYSRGFNWNAVAALARVPLSPSLAYCIHLCASYTITPGS